MHQEFEGVENEIEISKAETEEDIRSMASAINMKKGHARVLKHGKSYNEVCRMHSISLNSIPLHMANRVAEKHWCQH